MKKINNNSKVIREYKQMILCLYTCIFIIKFGRVP